LLSEPSQVEEEKVKEVKEKYVEKQFIALQHELNSCVQEIVTEQKRNVNNHLITEYP